MQIKAFCCALVAFPFWTVCAPLYAEIRAFTDVEGRVLRAELVEVDSGSVTLRLENGGLHKVPISRLSMADRAFVVSPDARVPAKPAPLANASSSAAPSFKFDWSSDRIGRKLRLSDTKLPVLRVGETRKVKNLPQVGDFEESGGRMWSEDWVCHFKLANLARTPVTELELQYEIFLQQDYNGTVQFQRSKKGSINVPLIEGLREAKLDSSQFKAWASKGSRTYSKEGKTYLMDETLYVDEIVGIAIKVLQKGAVIFEYESPRLKNRGG